MSDTFQELDGGTLFTGKQYWEFVDDTTSQKEMRTSLGAWHWDNVLSVQTITEAALPHLPEPRCVVELPSQYLYFHVEYHTVLAAWRRWRLRYGHPSLTFTTAN